MKQNLPLAKIIDGTLVLNDPYTKNKIVCKFVEKASDGTGVWAEIATKKKYQKIKRNGCYYFVEFNKYKKYIDKL